MIKLINEKIEILKETNKFNLESITNEEIGEFREARINYLKALKESSDKKHIQRKYEAMLDEIADVYVVTNQWNDPTGTRFKMLYLEENAFLHYMRSKHCDYINSVMLYKMERTLLRNLVDWYKK